MTTATVVWAFFLFAFLARVPSFTRACQVLALAVFTAPAKLGHATVVSFATGTNETVVASTGAGGIVHHGSFGGGTSTVIGTIARAQILFGTPHPTKTGVAIAFAQFRVASTRLVAIFRGTFGFRTDDAVEIARTDAQRYIGIRDRFASAMATAVFGAFDRADAGSTIHTAVRGFALAFARDTGAVAVAILGAIDFGGTDLFFAMHTGIIFGAFTDTFRCNFSTVLTGPRAFTFEIYVLALDGACDFSIGTTTEYNKGRRHRGGRMNKSSPTNCLTDNGVAGGGR
jgi:hypothetical protein